MKNLDIKRLKPEARYQLIFASVQKERKDKNFIKKPIYPGGMVAMRNFIRENLKYPKEALEKGIEGTVTLRYTINHLGAVIETHVISGLGHGCDEEARRLVRLFKFDVPKNRGVKVLFHKDIHVHFRLQKKKTVAQKIATQYVYTQAPAQTSTTPSRSYSYILTIPPKKKEG